MASFPYCPLKRWQDGIAAGALKRRHFRSWVWDVLGRQANLKCTLRTSSHILEQGMCSLLAQVTQTLPQDRCSFLLRYCGQVADKGKTKNITAFIDEEEDWGQCLGRWRGCLQNLRDQCIEWWWYPAIKWFDQPWPTYLWHVLTCIDMLYLYDVIWCHMMLYDVVCSEVILITYIILRLLSQGFLQLDSENHCKSPVHDVLRPFDSIHNCRHNWPSQKLIAWNSTFLLIGWA